jgi:hypothetical protein
MRGVGEREAATPPLQNSCDLPIFRVGKVTLHVSARKDGKAARLGRMGRDAKYCNNEGDR